MGSAISLRCDCDGAVLRRFAHQTKHGNQARRLLARAAIYDGGSRSDAARIGSVTVQIVRDQRFNARGPDGLLVWNLRNCSGLTPERHAHPRSRW